MPYDVHADLVALRARVDELARENEELRVLLEQVNAPARWTGEVDPRVGLPARELRRRRWKGRVIAAVLMALGIGVGASLAVLVRDDLRREFGDGNAPAARHTAATSQVRVRVMPRREVIVVPAQPGLGIAPPAPPAPPAARVAPLH